MTVHRQALPKQHERHGSGSQLEGVRMVTEQTPTGLDADASDDTSAKRRARLHSIFAQARKLAGQPKRGGHGTYSLEEILNLHVSRASVDAATRLLDSLFKAAESRGHSLKLSTGSEAQVQIIVDDEPFVMSVRERSKQIPHVPTKSELARANHPYSGSIFGPPKYDYEPSGELRLVLEHVYGTRTTWSDGKRQRAVDLIPNIVDTLEVVARERKECRLENQRLERERIERQIREHEESQRREKLTKQLQAWRTARDICEFVAAMQAAMSEAGEGGTDELRAWLEWALSYADRIDPVVRVRQHGS